MKIHFSFPSHAGTHLMKTSNFLFDPFLHFALRVPVLLNLNSFHSSIFLGKGILLDTSVLWGLKPLHYIWSLYSPLVCSRIHFIPLIHNWSLEPFPLHCYSHNIHMLRAPFKKGPSLLEYLLAIAILLHLQNHQHSLSLHSTTSA